MRNTRRRSLNIIRGDAENAENAEAITHTQNMSRYTLEPFSWQSESGGKRMFDVSVGLAAESNFAFSAFAAHML